MFDDAKRRWLAPKTLGRLFGNKLNNAEGADRFSEFEPVASDANNLDGLNIHCGIVDDCTHIKPVTSGSSGNSDRCAPAVYFCNLLGFLIEGIYYGNDDYAIKVLKNFDNLTHFQLRMTAILLFGYTSGWGTIT